MLGIYYGIVLFEDGTNFSTLFIEKETTIKNLNGVIEIMIGEENVKVDLKDFDLHLITQEINAVKRLEEKIKNNEVNTVNPFEKKTK